LFFIGALGVSYHVPRPSRAAGRQAGRPDGGPERRAGSSPPLSTIHPRATIGITSAKMVAHSGSIRVKVPGILQLGVV